MIEKKIKSIDFELLGPDVIRKMSAVRIVTPDTYDDSGFPIESGLMDLRLGVIDPGLRCKTCGGRTKSCPGHFGHIELVRPIVHMGYVKMTLTLLKTTCRKCGKILIKKELLGRYRNLLLKEEKEEDEEKTIGILEKTKKEPKCPGCGEKQENIKLLKPYTFFEGDQRLLPSQIRERLERIPEKELELLGINPKTARPEWAILVVLPVPPSTARPSITLETGERSEDDLTHKLVDIIRINQRLSDNISAGAPQLIIEDLWDLLQYHVTTYFNNEVSGIPAARHRSGRALKTLSQRLKGKEGRFRYYLSGKRVNFSARTVISPDPNISINEVGVPEAIARELTVPVYVSEWNLAEAKELLKRAEYPCANYLIRPDGKKKKITDLNREEVVTEVAPGYIIERQLKDGDITIFNRQPSLHRVSMMMHYAKILPGKTFRMNDAVAPPYNADYDGDEMNLHVPQTQEAIVEAEELMKVENHLLLIKNGESVIASHADFVSGLYFLTNAGTGFDKQTALRLLSRLNITDLPAEKDGKYAGKDIFNMVLPKGISLISFSKMCRKCGTCDFEKCPYNSFVIIENGKLKCGTVDAKILKQIIVKTFRECGPAVAKEFIDKITKLAVEVVTIRGLTSSLVDIMLTKEAENEIENKLEETDKRMSEFIDQYKKGELERIPGKTVEQTLEDTLTFELGKARDVCGKIAEKGLVGQNHYIMAYSGARGSPIQITQMSACMGVQAIRGKMLSRSYRTKYLPHFKSDDLRPETRGYVKSSLYKGLDPIEFFFASMSGRDSLVDKGINPARSGYMQRRLINALIDIVAQKDGTVKDASGQIVQFLYGEDGINPTYCTKGEFVNVEKELTSLDELKKLPTLELMKKL